MTALDEIAAIGIVTVSDRASAVTYRDSSGPVIEDFLRKVLTTPWRAVRRLVPDGIENFRDALIDLADREKCALIVTIGGTRPALRDLTPEGTAAACTKLMPGFGELMRSESLKQVPTEILSRQTVGVRESTLIVNLPGRPDSIRVSMQAAFPAIPYCLDLIGATRIETDSRLCNAFQPSK